MKQFIETTSLTNFILIKYFTKTFTYNTEFMFYNFYLAWYKKCISVSISIFLNA